MTKELLKPAQQEKLEKLQQLSQHMHENAFSNVWLGCNTYGVLEALPNDMIHAILHGILMYVCHYVSTEPIRKI